MKKIIALASLSSVVLLASCNGLATTKTNTSGSSTTTTTITEDKITTSSTTQTDTTTVSGNDSVSTSTSGTDTTTTNTTNPVGDDTTTTQTTTTVETTTTQTTTTTPIVLNEATLYMVGDSTMCSFADNYVYPRYGYGTQMSNWFDSKITMKNLAMSGRSSLSFTSESNYTTLKNSIQKGDYLLIGFGHNDEKDDDASRFRSAKYDSIEAALADENSFQSSLYNNYIKLAKEAGATPILATPIVRASTTDNYSGSEAHVTSNGDYRQAVIDVANYYDVAYVDLTTITKNQYTTLGFDEAKWYHAFTAGEWADDTKTTVVAKEGSIDKTHLNIYGAKFVSYQFAEALDSTDCFLKNYVKDDNVAPTKENDLVINSSYVPLEYESFDGTSYTPAAAFTTLTEGLYGTAIGDLGTDNITTTFQAKETSSGVFSVGTSAKKAKVAATFGFAGVFKQIDISKNYTISATAKVTTATADAITSSSGFGLMIRDDLYTPIRDASILSNCVCAGFITGSQATVNFSYENGGLVKTSNTASMYSVDSTATFTISRVGQNITATTEYAGKTYSTTYYDFDLQSIDNPYYYIGMWATRGTIVEFSNVSIEYTGDYAGA